MSNNLKPIVFCEGCLSTDRKLTDIEEYYDIYIKILDDENCKSKKKKYTLLCWECKAMLHNIYKFRERVEKANTYLNKGLCYIKKKGLCLSNLCSTSTVSDNITYVYKKENNDTYDVKKEDVVDDNIDESNNINVTWIDEAKLKTEEIESDFENEGYVETDNISNSDIEKDEDIKEVSDARVKDEKVEIKRKRLSSYTNERYTVNDLSKEEIQLIRKNCKRVVMDNNEIALWREKLKLARNYRLLEYKCHTCITAFAKKQYYDVHMKKYHSQSNGDYECHLCKQIVPDRLIAHHVKWHSTKFVCSVCNIDVFPIYNLDVHLNSVHKRIVECMACKQQFRSRMKANSHYIREHLKRARFECNDCGRGWTAKKELIHHITLRHTEHRCKICDRVYKSYDALKRHKLANHVKAASEHTYCVECNMQFNNDYLFQQHLKLSTKHRQKRFPCLECGKVYHKRTTLNNHYNLVHLQKTKHYCELCDRYFLTGYRLRQHKATAHDRIPKTKTKICSICGRGFNTNRILQNHMRTHTGERPFHCEHCTSSFTQKNALVSHTRAIHKIS